MEEQKNNQEQLPENEAVSETAEEVLEAASAAEEASAEEIVPEEATPAEPVKKVTSGKIALAVAAVVVLAAALIAMVTVGAKNNKPQETAAETSAVVEETAPATIPEDGNPDDVTCKGTYTVTDEVAVAEKNTVVATIGDAALTNAQLRMYYRSAINSFLNTEYGYYMMMYGALDYSKPLDTQLAAEGDKTWQQFFIQYALDNWRLTQALAMEAEKNGIEMTADDQEYLKSLRATLEEMAKNHSLTVEEMLAADFGAGVEFADFEEYQTLYMKGNPYYTAQTEKLVPTEEELEAYFKENEETYAASGVTMDSKFVDVRHILVQVEGGTADETGAVTYSEDEWAACEAEAQAILDAWLAGDKTEDSFAALANEKSEDPGSNTNGGLYENVYMGQMLEPFETWCFDENRQYGDYGLVQTSYGYHVMFFVGSEPMWIQYAESGWTNDKISLFLDEIVKAYPMDVTFENISLGEMKMA